MSGPKLLPNQSLDRGNFAFFNFAAIEGDQNDNETMEKYWSETSERHIYDKQFMLDQTCIEVTGVPMMLLIDTNKPLARRIKHLNPDDGILELKNVDASADHGDAYVSNAMDDMILLSAEYACEYKEWPLVSALHMTML